jgi:uncharacterized membrane protein
VLTRRFREDATSMPRVVAMAVVATVTGLFVARVAPWQLSIDASWSAGCVTFLAVVWLSIGRCDGPETARLATVEDDSRFVAGLLLLTASTASLIGVAVALHRADETHGAQQVALTVVALITIVLSWLVVNTVFTLRYAHLFYTPPVGGIDFPGSGDLPDYRDFAYLAFTIGMTYQVSDTGLRAPKFRGTVLGHALLSYLFGTGIVAATINIVAGFVR